MTYIFNDTWPRFLFYFFILIYSCEPTTVLNKKKLESGDAKLAKELLIWHGMTHNVPAWLERQVCGTLDSWHSTFMLFCLSMKWQSSPDTLLTFMSVWYSGTYKWLSRVPGMVRADTNRSSNNALWLLTSAAVTKNNVICWILYTHQSNNYLTDTICPSCGLWRLACAVSHLAVPPIQSHVFFTMAGHKETTFAIQSKVTVVTNVCKILEMFVLGNRYMNLTL